jgi:hypothetical protein
MQKFTPIKCLTCGETFTPKSERNTYCKRSCFKKAFYHRKKAEELSACHFPFFTCPECRQAIRLDFDPTVDTMRWLEYKCPGCYVLMINVSEQISTKDESIQ